MSTITTPAGDDPRQTHKASVRITCCRRLLQFEARYGL